MEKQSKKPTPKIKNSISFFKEIRTNIIAYIMAVPGIIVIFAFSIVPLAFIAIAFQRYNAVMGFFHSPFVGLDNFKFFFSLGDKVWQTLFNTVYLNILFISTGVVMQVGVAILINEVKNRAFKRIVQSIFFFPYFLSWVVISSIIYGLLSTEYGSINTLLLSIGKDPVRWYAKPEYWRTILVLTRIWKFTGYGSIIYLAAISGFDPSCYESAYVDGANKAQQIFHLTLPLLKPTIVIMVLLSIGTIFYGDFGMIYAIVRDVGPLLAKTEVIDSYVFRTMRTEMSFSMPTAIGLCQSIMGMITILASNHLMKKINDGTALF